MICTARQCITRQYRRARSRDGRRDHFQDFAETAYCGPAKGHDPVTGTDQVGAVIIARTRKLPGRRFRRTLTITKAALSKRLQSKGGADEQTRVHRFIVIWCVRTRRA
jgi:hypothetical protein